jgi:hypothetical protein
VQPRPCCHDPVTAVAGVFKARAHAEEGEADQAKAAIGLAEEELGGAKPEDDPPFIYYFDRAVLDAHAGLASEPVNLCETHQPGNC